MFASALLFLSRNIGSQVALAERIDFNGNLKRS